MDWCVDAMGEFPKNPSRSEIKRQHDISIVVRGLGETGIHGVRDDVVDGVFTEEAIDAFNWETFMKYVRDV